MRYLVIAFIAAVAGLAASTGAGAGGQGGFGCAVGWDIGPLTLQQVFELPRVQAGLSAGAYDASYVVSSFHKADHNGNGAICVKDNATLNGEAGPWQYVYNIVDDNSAASTG